ncbi:hypothetical protein PG995_014806 [Apiospora arundinis]
MSDSPTKRCLFESLPTELLIEVLKGLPDLTSLDSILHASPVVYRILDECAVQVTDTILACDYKFVVSYHRHPCRTDEIHHGPHAVESGITCAAIRVMFYMMAAIRTSSLPVHSLADFHHRVCDPFWWDTTRNGRATVEYFMPESLPKDTPPKVVRSLIATYSRINWLSLDCLKLYLTRFESIRPSHPIMSRKALKKGGYRDGTMPPETKLEAFRDVRPAPVRQAGPPSWTEEQRVNRAFWRLQLLSDLKKAAANSLLAEWSNADIETLRDFDDAKLLGLYIPFHDPEPFSLSTWASQPEWQEIRTALDYLCSTHDQHWPDQVVLPPEHRHRRPRLSTMIQTHDEEVTTWPLPRHEVRGDKKLAKSSAACEAWDQLYSMIAYGEGCGGGAASFAPFLRLGFAFWSEERLRAHGLIGNANNLGYHSIWRFGSAWYNMTLAAGNKYEPERDCTLNEHY